MFEIAFRGRLNIEEILERGSLSLPSATTGLPAPCQKNKGKDDFFGDDNFKIVGK